MDRPSKGMRRSGGQGGGRYPARSPRGRFGRLMESFFGDPWAEAPAGWAGEEWTPEIELSDEDDAVVVRVEVPGVSPEDIDVSVSGNLLTISGEKREERNEGEGNVYRSERWYGSFQRTIPLPEGVNPDAVSCECSNGVLTLRFEKEEGRGARRIRVSGRAGNGGQERQPRRKTLKDVMTRDVECARPDEPVREVARRMKDMDIGSFPVCDEERKVVGMITDRDLAVRVLAEGKDPGAARVRDVMTADVITCGEDEAVEQAERMMKEHKIRRIPVVDGLKKLVGYFTIGKVARTERPEQSKEILKSVTESPGTKS